MWHLGTCSSCYPNGVSLYPLMVRQQGIGKRGFDSNAFSSRWLRRLIKGVFFAGLSFVNQSIPFPQHDPLIHKCLFHSLALGCVREYFRAAHVLAPFSFAPTSSNTTLVLIAPHPKSNGYFPLFLKKWAGLGLRAFLWFLQVGILIHVTFISNWSLWDGCWTPSRLFSSWRFSKWIPQLFQLCFHIAQGHILP
jgi:hypothetical protein